MSYKATHNKSRRRRKVGSKFRKLRKKRRKKR